MVQSVSVGARSSSCGVHRAAAVPAAGKKSLSEEQQAA